VLSGVETLPWGPPRGEGDRMLLSGRGLTAHHLVSPHFEGCSWTL
jgi:hypothetical protein